LKPGYKTTEFWISVLTAGVGVVAAAGGFTPDQVTAVGDLITTGGGLIAAALAAFGYAISRGLAKKDT